MFSTHPRLPDCYRQFLSNLLQHSSRCQAPITAPDRTSGRASNLTSSHSTKLTRMCGYSVTDIYEGRNTTINHNHTQLCSSYPSRPSRIRTGDPGMKVLSDNHFTMSPNLRFGQFSKLFTTSVSGGPFRLIIHSPYTPVLVPF